MHTTHTHSQFQKMYNKSDLFSHIPNCRFQFDNRRYIDAQSRHKISQVFQYVWIPNSKKVAFQEVLVKDYINVQQMFPPSLFGKRLDVSLWRWKGEGYTLPPSTSIDLHQVLSWNQAKHTYKHIHIRLDIKNTPEGRLNKMTVKFSLYTTVVIPLVSPMSNNK